MADGAKLASGYIELTVKAGEAMKEITAEITGVGKQAEKVGRQAGEALDKGISKGAKGAGKSLRDEMTSAANDAGDKAGAAIDKGVSKGAKKAGKSVGDEITKAATKAGEDAGDAIDKGVSKGAKKAGKSVGDEITKATKKAGDDVANTKIEPKITPKVDRAATKKEAQSIPEILYEEASKVAKSNGYNGFEDLLVDVAGKAGKKVGAVLGSALGNTPLGGMFKGVQDGLGPVLDGIDKFRESFQKINDGNPLSPVANNLKDIAGTLGNFNGSSKLESTLAGIGGKAAQLGLIVTALGQITQLVGDPRTEKVLNGDFGSAASLLGQNVGTGAAIGGSIAGVPGAIIGGGAGVVATGGEVVTRAIEDHEQAKRDAAAAAIRNGVPATAPTSQQQQDALKDLFAIPPRAAGGIAGVDSNGRIYGPGNGTSDSILAVGADGMPTARVSRGEGVVKKQAMDNGAAAIVAGLNNGDLPGYDDGTNNVGGPPIPTPEVKVPAATTGQAGTFNDWLSQQQGKAYQYGTLYDCSGFMSQVYNQMTGKQMPRFNTESDLSAYGFVRGSQAGTFQLGIHHGGGGPNSHMAGTLPDGRAVESGGNGVQIGAGAHGAFDKQFEDHWYLPGSGSMGGQAGAPADPASLGAAGGPGGVAQRTQGYIPAGAGGSGQAGSSLFSGILQNGAAAVNGLIDQAASAAATGVGAMSMGAGGSAAASAIGIGTQAAKRGVSYGFQMAGIGADALAEILLPFGVPRFFQTDPTQFMPQLGTQPTGVTTGEKAQLSGAQQASGQAPNPALNPGGPVQAGQLPGAQPVGAPVQMAGPTGIESAPVPIGAPAGVTPAAPAGPAVPQPEAPPAPQSGPMADPAAQQQPPKKVQTGIAPFDKFLGGLAGGGVVGVYDDGGWLQPGGIAINESKRPEPVFNHEQWGALQDNLANTEMGAPDPAAMGGGRDYSVHFHDTVVKDVNEMLREADSRSRLQMMRHAGRP